MAVKGLDLQQAPPISVPLRFFLTAPVFALAAAAVALWYGADAFASRFAPATLAIAHLVALGCVTMIMAGALMQIMPVLAGAPFARPRAIASIVHATLTAGTIALACAFLHGERALFAVAAVLLGAGFAVFIAAIAHALARARAGNPTLRMLWLVGAALVVTVTLGVWLASSRAFATAMPATLPDLHPAWALLGWVGLLAAAVAQRVVPMFQLTPEYPGRLSRTFGWAVFGTLVAWSFAKIVDAPLAPAAALALAAPYAAFAAATLRLQAKRRRRQFDVNLLFWRTGMACAIAAALVWVATLAVDLPPAFTVALGVLAIAGAALSIVDGMLYRIVPFLAWYHLYARAGPSPYVPHLKDYLAETSQRRQLWLHVTATAMLLAATAWPELLARPAAVALAASAAQWLLNLVAIVRVYTRHRAALAQTA
jgi:hypothetical protein